MAKQIGASKKKRRSVSFAAAPLHPPPPPGFTALHDTDTDTMEPSQFSLDGFPPNYLSPSPRFASLKHGSTPETPKHAFWMPETPQLPTDRVASLELKLQHARQAEARANARVAELESNSTSLISQNNSLVKIKIKLEQETKAMVETIDNLRCDGDQKMTALNSKVQSLEASHLASGHTIEALELEKQQMLQKMAELKAKNAELSHYSAHKEATFEQKIAVLEAEKLALLERIEEQKRNQLNKMQHMTEQIEDLEFSEKQNEIKVNILTRVNENLDASKHSMSGQIEELTRKSSNQHKKITALETENAAMVSKTEQLHVASIDLKESILRLKSEKKELTNKVSDLQEANRDQQRLITVLECDRTELAREVEENRKNKYNESLLAWETEKRELMDVAYERYEEVIQKCAEIRVLKERIKQLESELAADDGSNESFTGRQVSLR